MNDEMECMCLECGISVLLSLETIALGDFVEGQRRQVDNIFCTECGGPLVLVGKAGDEAYYRTDKS